MLGYHMSELVGTYLIETDLQNLSSSQAATVDKRGASFKDMRFYFNNLVPDFGSSI